MSSDNEFEHLTAEQKAGLKFALLAGEAVVDPLEFDCRLRRLHAWANRVARDSAAMDGAVAGRFVATFESDRSEPALRPASWVAEDP